MSVLDHGLTVGDGVFETLLVRDGTPFALTRHLARLGRSLAGLGLTGPPDAVLREAVAARGVDLDSVRIELVPLATIELGDPLP